MDVADLVEDLVGVLEGLEHLAAVATTLGGDGRLVKQHIKQILSVEATDELVLDVFLGGVDEKVHHGLWNGVPDVLPDNVKVGRQEILCCCVSQTCVSQIRSRDERDEEVKR